MKFLWGCFLLLAAGVLQWMWAAFLPFLGPPPQLMLALTVAASIVFGSVWGESLGFWGGLWLDVLSTHLFGGTALSLCWIGYGTGLLRRQMDVSNMASQMAVVFAASLVHGVVMQMLGLFFMRHWAAIGFFAFMGGSLLNALAAPLVFAIAGYVERRHG